MMLDASLDIQLQSIDGRMKKETLAIVSRELATREVFLDTLNSAFRKVANRSR